MGETPPYTIEMYVTPTGRSPFQDWLRGLRDVQARARIRVRLDRLSLGNPGDAPSGPTTLLVLCGGDKTTQTADRHRCIGMTTNGESAMSKLTKDYRKSLLEDLQDPAEAAAY